MAVLVLDPPAPAAPSRRSPCCVYLLVPNVVVAVFSFNDPVGKFNYNWARFSTDAWTHPCGSPGHLRVARAAACGSG